MLDTLKFWHGEMDEKSIGASLYSVWHYMLFKTFFKSQFTDPGMRLSVVSNYAFQDFFQRLVYILEEEPTNERYNQVCKNGYDGEYSGDKPCVYNMVRAMVEAYEFMVNEVSSKMGEDWQWHNLHVNDYPNVPWSLTPLKFFFHREIKAGGNANTIKVSKYSFAKFQKTRSFKSSHTPNYKEVIQISDNLEEEKMVYSIDGGQSGNPFAGHYFDMAHDHTAGYL